MEEIAVAFVELADNMGLSHRANVSPEAAIGEDEKMIGGGPSTSRETIQFLVLDWASLLTAPDGANE